MKPFLRSKAGIGCVSAFLLGMAWMFHHVLSQQRPQSAVPASPPRASAEPAQALPKATPEPSGAAKAGDAPANAAPTAGAPGRAFEVSENAAYLDQYYHGEDRILEAQDRQGNAVTRRLNASTPSGAGQTTVVEAPLAPPMPARGSLRLQGHPRPAEPATGAKPVGAESQAPLPAVDSHAAREASTPSGSPAFASPDPAAGSGVRRNATPRFNPYGRVIKCELVFTLDSTNEETPLIGIVMEPVYNNGQLIIPAGAEFHGVARPDRLRDRIFSGENWVLVFPRERGRPNGRQLSVQGVALDRIEPTGSGVTWGITDGSYGLEGRIIRSLEGEEIKRFAATFLSQASLTLQERQSGRGGQQTVLNTPQNAVLQGLSANLEKIAADISAEIAKHGVFIRVPAGHQFYFYPKQRIEPDLADPAWESKP